MSECLTRLGADMDIRSIINRKTINSLVTDNYTVLVIFIVISTFLFIIIYYFAKNMFNTIRRYQRYNRKLELSPPQTDNQMDPESDSEQYTKQAVDKSDIGVNKLLPRDEPLDYLSASRKDFLKDVKATYDDYNVLKSQYIRSTYSKGNDDVIDENIMFRKHDDYKYTKNPEYDDY